jgi:putative ABC transport system permease protein
MTRWLLMQTVRAAPRRLVLGALGVAFPVAIFAAGLLFMNRAVESMTTVTLEPLKLEQRALATNLNADMTSIAHRLATVPGVKRVDRFAAADVVVRTPGTSIGATARLFAVDPAYAAAHPWVRVVDGSLAHGALLGQSLRHTPGFESARAVRIELAGSTHGLKLKVPVSGTVDLRNALSAWFAIPIGEVQGDQALVPRSLVIDYTTFEQRMLPAIKRQLGTTTPVLNPGLTDLPPVSLEAHVSVDHRAYPADPGSAATWSKQLKNKLGKQAFGDIVVADDAYEPLTEASSDAGNAKTLFILLAIPGALVAAALGLAAQSALAETTRREDALLRLRGASEGQLVRLAAAQAAVCWAVGSVTGLAAAAAAVTAVTGKLAWEHVPAGGLVLAIVLGLAIGALTTLARVIGVVRASRRPEVVERRRLELGWRPLWRRAWLDVGAIAVGAGILAVNIGSGGLKPVPIEPAQGSTLALRFYVLLGLMFIWVGVILLAIRLLLAVASRWGRARRPLSSWRSATLRWIARRPARAGVALVLGALAVAFGTQVLAFVATYRSAKDAENNAAFGSSLRLVPGDPVTPLPPIDAHLVSAISPVRMVPARAESDRKTIMTLDVRSYRAAATASPRMQDGAALAGLARDPQGVVISQEIASDFEVGPGDRLPLTVFPDDKDQSRNIKLRVVGIYRSFPPANPPAEMVMGTRALPPYLLQKPDFYLARTPPGASPTAVARDLKRTLHDRFAATTISDQVRFEPRSLTALNLGPLGQIELVGAALIAAVGVAVLGAFVVVERRREFAILRTVGADDGQLRAGPAREGAVAVLGSLAIGVPVGLALAVASVRILGLFFTLPPPLVTVPVPTLIAFAAVFAAASAVAIGAALAAVAHVSPATTLREP